MAPWRRRHRLAASTLAAMTVTLALLAVLGPQSPSPRPDVDAESLARLLLEPPEPAPFRDSPAPSRPAMAITLRSRREPGLPLLQDGVFWSEALEAHNHPGVSEDDVNDFLKRVRGGLQILLAEESTWDRCGRPKNHYLTLEDGSHACARYRTPHYYLVQGELLSFYLSRLLGMRNVPPSVLTQAFRPAAQWRLVRPSLLQAGWERRAFISLTQWVPRLQRTRIPEVLLDALLHNRTLSLEQLADAPLSTLVELLQWSDLLVFDYITGNYDRLASMQDAANKERRPAALQEPVHNLVRSHDQLWLVDNESGLLDGYGLLYTSEASQRFRDFHRIALASLCAFRYGTAARVAALHANGSAPAVLLDSVLRAEPRFVGLPGSVLDHRPWLQHLPHRVTAVHQHIEACRRRGLA